MTDPSTTDPTTADPAAADLATADLATAEAAGALEVDWEMAGRWAGRLASPGPTPSRAVLQHLVGDLHQAAERARTLAVRASRLAGPLDAAGRADARAQVLVVDRSGWTRGAAQSFEALMHQPGPSSPRTGVLGRVPGAVRAAPATAQAAGLLGLLASRVLGQYDPYTGPDGGRLLLVAPNVLRVERALDAVPADFRLWVCVHEQTHALQFASAPWLAGHLRDEVAALVAELSRSSAGQELTQAVARGLRTLRSGTPDEDRSPLDLVLDDEQRARVDRLGAVMAVLEGHADVSMDAVGARAVPTVRHLRRRMDARRRAASGVDRWLRRLIGMDAKLAQYRQGARFVRGVRRSGGRDALDAVWTSPDALPSPAELADPAAWVRRVLG